MGYERGERRDHKVSVACSRLHLGDTGRYTWGWGCLSQDETFQRPPPKRGREMGIPRRGSERGRKCLGDVLSALGFLEPQGFPYLW